MKTDAQLRESIARFLRISWQKKPDGRPPVGVVNTDLYLPVKYLRRPFLRSHVEPEDVRADWVLSDYEFAFASRQVNCDDFIPFAAPWRAIPWLEAWCGCPVRYASGSLAPEPIIDSVETLAAASFPAKESGSPACVGRPGSLRPKRRATAGSAQRFCGEPRTRWRRCAG